MIPHIDTTVWQREALKLLKVLICKTASPISVRDRPMQSYDFQHYTTFI